MGSRKNTLNPFKYFSKGISRFRKLRKSHRNIVLASALVGVLLIVGIWSYVFSKNSTDNQLSSTENTNQSENIGEKTQTLTATLSFLEGVVEYKNDQGEWLDTSKDQILENGNGLRTRGAASKAIITLQDGSEIRLDANTEIGIESLSETRVELTQKSGYLYNRIVSSAERDYFVTTADAHFQSEGTAFRTTASGDEQSVEVFENSVKETKNNISTSQGEKLIIESESNPSKNRNKEKMDIELIKQDSFISWNRELDLKNPKFKSSLGFLSDIEGPKIDITDPVVGSTIEIESSSSSGEVNIKGKTEKDASLSVQSKSQTGSSPINVTVSEDGSFETGKLVAPVGSSVFEFIATDKTGNKTKQNITYIVKKKSTSAQAGIALTVDALSDPTKVKLSWGLVNITTPDGVKLLYSDSGDPVFPDDKKQLISNGTTSVDVKVSDLDSGKTYKFMVCRYDNDTSTCDIFSNTVSVYIP